MGIDYDLITMGGGLAGAALAKAMAEKGHRVLVLERETTFRDRVRGELVHPWGVSETRALGIYDLLKETCGNEVRFRTNQVIGLTPPNERDMQSTTPHKAGSLHFYHPEMQQVLLDAAAQAGADVRRGATVTNVSPGRVPSVSVRDAEGEQTFQARLVVGADGRASACRKWAGWTIQRDPERMVIAGVVFTGVSAPRHTYHIYSNPPRGEIAFQIPLTRDRFRCYYAFYQQPGRRRLAGPDAVADFVEASAGAGAPREWFTGVQAVGPLASFDCAENWVDHPYREGVALVGDAAAVSDASFGCGLSLTLRDVRVLSHLLLTETDWDAAAHLYAAEHDRYFSSLHRLLDWQTRLLLEPGAVAATRRERAFARILENPRRGPDIAGLGPEAPSDDDAYRDLFGEEPQEN